MDTFISLSIIATFVCVPRAVYFFTFGININILYLSTLEYSLQFAN